MVADLAALPERPLLRLLLGVEVLVVLRVVHGIFKFTKSHHSSYKPQ